MKHFIVIGNPIAHSKSPEIHHAFARQAGIDICYTRQFCPNDKDSFTAVVQAFFNGGGIGANVTLPFKEMAFSLCQATGALSKNAQMAGAVNTLMIKNDVPFGDNTDGLGLVQDLQASMDLTAKTVLIIGAGGATRGVILPLLEAGIAHITIANRTKSRADTLVQYFAPCAKDKLSAVSLDELYAITKLFDIIINATSSTTTGEQLILPPTLNTTLAYDMMYGKPSPFLEHFLKQEATIKDGKGMLIGQAAFSFEFWTGIKANSLNLLALSI